MGVSIGVAALGAVLTHQVADCVTAALSRLGIPADTHRNGTIPDVSSLDEPFRSIFEHAFGEATGHLFLVAVPFAVLALVCVLFIKEVPLRTTILRADEIAAEAAPDVASARREG